MGSSNWVAANDPCAFSSFLLLNKTARTKLTKSVFSKPNNRHVWNRGVKGDLGSAVDEDLRAVMIACEQNGEVFLKGDTTLWVANPAQL